MYTQNNNNGNTIISQDVWQQKHQVKIICWTKSRPNRDGNGSNRGVEIESLINSETRWVTLWSGHALFKLLNWGNQCTYDPNVEPENRLQIGNAGQQTGLTPPQEPQSLGQQIEESYTGPRVNQRELDYQSNNYPNTAYSVVQNGQQSNSQNTVDDQLIEKISLVLANCMNMSMSLNPQLDSDNQTKLAISAAIQYFKLKSQDIPF